MSDERNKPERKYALIRVKAGIYLLPSNDAKTLWRISAYTEDGSAMIELPGGRWKAITGTFWETARRAMPKAVLDLDADDGLWGDDWENYGFMHATRADAIEEALRAK